LYEYNETAVIFEENNMVSQNINLFLHYSTMFTKLEDQNYYTDLSALMVQIFDKLFKDPKAKLSGYKRIVEFIAKSKMSGMTNLVFCYNFIYKCSIIDFVTYCLKWNST